jgi:hypothetical protein
MAIVASGQLTLTDLNDAKQLVMYIGASQSRTVIFNGVSTYSPNYSSTNQVLTPQLFVAGDNADVASEVTGTRWFYQSNGTGTPVAITANTTDFTLGTNNATLTIKTNIMSSRTSMTIICELDYPDSQTGFTVTSKAEIEIVKVTNGIDGDDGINAITALLSNESDTIPTDSAGNNGNYTGTGTEVHVFEGATALAYDGVGTSNGTWKVTTSASGVTAGALTDGGAHAVMANVSAITADSAMVTFTITGKSSGGTAFTLTKKQTFSRSKQGIGGTSPTLYRFLPSANAIKKSNTGVYSPASIVLDGKSQTGNGAYGAYSARFKIYTTTAVLNASTNWGTAVYTSSSDQSTYTYPATGTFPANITGVKIEMYQAGGTTVLLDSQVIPVVTDGIDSVYAYVWNPDGNTVKNGSGSVSCHIDVYNGATPVTATAFKWYIQDPSATTSSGGDTDGGNGWRLLNATYNAGSTGYTTDTLTVPASAIAGTEAFKCVATYNSIKYSGVTTVVDLSDPILVRLDGVDKFKNGEGEVTVRATLLQSGVEIDATGTGGYTYAWSIYNSANVKTAFAKTGKSITVNATDISGRGNLVCDVSK